METFGISHIQAAAQRIAPYIVRTPVLASPMLDAAANARLFVKAESLQLTGSFKVRGALNKILGLPEGARHSGVIAFSAGNHGQGVAAAAKTVGCPAVIVMPRNAARIKIDNCRWWGAETVFYDPATEVREEVTSGIAAERGLTLISPFDDWAIMAGQGTAGLEFSEHLIGMNVVPDAVVVPCSGGGIASGVIESMANAFPGAEKYIVEPTGYDKMAQSLLSGDVTTIPGERHTVMDGISGPTAGQRTLEVLKRHDVQGLTVNDDETLNAVAHGFYFLKTVLEPAGAAALAAVLSRKADFADKIVAVVGTGGNVDASVFTWALQTIPQSPITGN